MKNKQNLNILIIDDEVKASKYLKEVVEDALTDHPKFHLNKILTLNNTHNYLDCIESNGINLLFLDINMPGKNGIEVAREIKQYKIKNNVHLPFICFTTAYDNYALQAFNEDAIDYILKPIADEKIVHFFDKLAANFIIKNDFEYIVAPTHGIDVKIELQEIFYFKSEGKYVSINTLKKSILILESITNLEEKYEEFIKVHRSYVVNKKYINNFFKKDQQWYVNLKQINKDIPVSRRQKVEIEGKLNYSIFEED